MEFKVVLQKMRTELDKTVQYYLDANDDFLMLNQLLGKKIEIKFSGFTCLSCSSNKKIFRQGHCYDCFYKSPAVADWVMKPELSKAHLNEEDRDLDYEKKAQLQPHIVYLAKSGAIKVGVTRKQQVPTRWIDQGASEAMKIVEVPNRYLAGITEVALKNHITDKTSWQKMLKNEITTDELIEKANQIKAHLPKEIEPYWVDSSPITTITYPVLEYPKKVASVSIEKNAINDTLVGIKGQYLIFENQSVFNVRSHEGYNVIISI